MAPAKPPTKRNTRYLTARARAKAQQLALDAVAKGHTLEEAAAAAGVSRRLIFRWREEDADFALQFQDAVEAGTDVFRTELRRRALDGIEEPVFHQGQQVGAVRKFSDTLLIFELKRRDPTYRDRVEVSGAGGGPVKTEVEVQAPDVVAAIDRFTAAVTRAAARAAVADGAVRAALPERAGPAS